MHINNLYKDQRVLAFREVYLLEKVHGTSAHLSWRKAHDPTCLLLYSGGASHDMFEKCFNLPELEERFEALGLAEVTVYGEAYGGKMQGMKDVYGPDLRFIVFDVKVGESWLDVPNMDEVATKLGLEVVPWTKVAWTQEGLDIYRDSPSQVAQRRGCGHQLREGIVIRPPFEVTVNNGERVMAKHKGEVFSERVHTPKVRPDKLEVETQAEAIAQEWVTECRLSHVLDKLVPSATELRDIPRVNEAMVEDVYREAKGEIVESKEAAGAIKRRAAKLFKARVTKLPD